MRAGIAIKRFPKRHDWPPPDNLAGRESQALTSTPAAADRAWELADITEHVSAWVDTEFDVPAFLEHFDLRPAEAARLRDSRRLFALCWLKLLRLQDQPHPRNPPGTVEKQAQRLLDLLGC